jgi:hypothetical protein
VNRSLIGVLPATRHAPGRRARQAREPMIHSPTRNLDGQPGLICGSGRTAPI